MTEAISRDAAGIPIKQTTSGFFGPNSRAWIAGFLVALGFLAFCFYRGINLPWVENDNYYGAIYAQAAHNNLRAGLKATGGIPATLYFGPLPIPVDAYYVHHPTLLPLLTTASFAVFGESEWATRLVPVICSMLSMIFIWLFLSDVVNRRAAAFATAIFATLPMELHYGDMVDFEPCLLMLMLATLVCLRYWHQRGNFWGWVAAFSCLLTVWMDWPGYLFVLSITGYYFLKGTKKQRLFALGLLAICGFSGMAFLLQIQHVNPDAWSDLWTALKMRLGNGVATGSSAAESHSDIHFTFAQWCGAIKNALHEDFLITPWILAGLGTALTVLRMKGSEAMRWAGWGTLHMMIAGILYVVILRNESYIHDFTTFYLIAAVAMMGAVFMDGFCKCLEDSRLPTSLGAVISLALVGWLGFSGYTQANAMRSMFGMLDGVTAEPENLIPNMGKKLAVIFPEGTTLLCNFDPYSSVLPYYAERTILNNLTSYDDWKEFLSQDDGPFGGIIWLDAPQASEILAALPKNEVTDFTMDGFHFALWKPVK